MLGLHVGILYISVKTDRSLYKMYSIIATADEHHMSDVGMLSHVLDGAWR